MEEQRKEEQRKKELEEEKKKKEQDEQEKARLRRELESVTKTGKETMTSELIEKVLVWASRNIKIQILCNQ